MTAICVRELQHTDWEDALDSDMAAWWLEHSNTEYEPQSSVDLGLLISAASGFDKETMYAHE